MAETDPVKVLAEALIAGWVFDPNHPNIKELAEEGARNTLAAMPDYTIVRRDLFRQMNAELRQMSSRLDEQGDELAALQAVADEARQVERDWATAQPNESSGPLIQLRAALARLNPEPAK